jgi:hypothetical protein
MVMTTRSNTTEYPVVPAANQTADRAHCTHRLPIRTTTHRHPVYGRTHLALVPVCMYVFRHNIL